MCGLILHAAPAAAIFEDERSAVVEGGCPPAEVIDPATFALFRRACLRNSFEDISGHSALKVVDGRAWEPGILSYLVVGVAKIGFRIL